MDYILFTVLFCIGAQLEGQLSRISSFLGMIIGSGSITIGTGSLVSTRVLVSSGVTVGDGGTMAVGVPLDVAAGAPVWLALEPPAFL